MAEGFAACLATAFDPAGFELCRGRSGSELCLAPSHVVLQPCEPTVPFSSEEKLDFHGCVGSEMEGLPDFCCVHRAPALPKADLTMFVELMVFSLPQSDLCCCSSLIFLMLC